MKANQDVLTTVAPATCPLFCCFCSVLPCHMVSSSCHDLSPSASSQFNPRTCAVNSTRISLQLLQGIWERLSSKGPTIFH
ncbi:hypothetical protein FKM82_004054 [Ascaphus truei]